MESVGHPSRPLDRLRSVDNHMVELSADDRRRLVAWLERPNGSLVFDRVSFDAVEGGGVLVRTLPYQYPGEVA